ncbi:MAG: tetratricopeptide repeat protein [Elusimicrobia bacterium]|nr:tetratricopeptide repeat protein [Elusimicrobiota bacterium]
MRGIRLSWLLGAVFLVLPCRPTPAQDGPGLLREASAPGRIDGQAAEKYRQSLPEQATQQAVVAVATAPAPKASPAPAPPERRLGYYGALAVALLLALAALAAVHIGRKRKAEAERRRAEAERLKAAAPPPPQPDDEAALQAGAADEAKGDTLADYVLRANKTPEFLSRCQGRPDEFLAGYARSFLKLGAWEVSAALLRGKKDLTSGERLLCQALETIIQGRGGRPAAEVYAESLLLAAELSRLGGHDEALALLTPALAQRAAASASDCLVVARVHQAADRVSDFLAQAKERRQAQFHKAYAAAFYALQDPETALALIRMKRLMEGSDYPLFVACHKELGRIAQLNLAAVPDADRIPLAEALMQAGEDAAALRALQEDRLEALSRMDLTVALRICHRLKDIETAARLFQQIKLTVGLADAPELYALYALVCEEVGRGREARDVYDEILRRFPDHQEATERLRNLSRNK